MSAPKRATLNDVARHAGVSVTTASYILNDRSREMRISEETEARVRGSIEELRYRPNRTAQNLRVSKTQTIGFLSDFVASGAYSSQLITGVNAAARRSSHVALIGETMGNREVEQLLIEEMIDRGVDGIVYATLAASRVELPDVLQTVRTVTLNCRDPRLEIPAVLPDDVLAGVLAAKALIDNVPGDLFIVGEDPSEGATAGRDRVQGIEKALGRFGGSIAGSISTAWDVEPAYEATSTWLANGGRPASLICLNDRVAMGVYQALRDFDLSIPGDVSVVSFDGSEIAHWLRPKLTSITLPFEEMGTLAVEILLGQHPHHKATTHVPPTLLVGDSVAI